MNDVAFAQTLETDPAVAGRALAEALLRDLGRPPQAAIVFASSRYAYPDLLEAFRATARPEHLVGCSSAGEFVRGQRAEGAACALGLVSDEMQFASRLARGLKADAAGVADRLVEGFRGLEGGRHNFRSAVVFCDALAGSAEVLIERLTLRTHGQYQLFGGGAGDDARFQSTAVFCGTEAHSDAAVALEILSERPLGIGVSHGWAPVGRTLRVTAAEGMRLVSLDAAPAVEAFQEHAEATGQAFDSKDPVPFFLHNVLGIQTPHGQKLRVPLGVNPDGSIQCAAEIPVGSQVSFMSATAASSAEAAATATREAILQLGGDRPKAALFFDCVATRLRMGREFGLELDRLKGELGGAGFAGYNTYGQIARADGQFCGFHNCTAVVCVIPD